jgi:hypothetical protein
MSFLLAPQGGAGKPSVDGGIFRHCGNGVAVAGRATTLVLDSV